MIVFRRLSARHANGVEVPPGARVDFAEVMERMRAGASFAESDRFREPDSAASGWTCSSARTSSPGLDTVEVAGKTLRFRRAVLRLGDRSDSSAL